MKKRVLDKLDRGGKLALIFVFGVLLFLCFGCFAEASNVKTMLRTRVLSNVKIMLRRSPQNLNLYMGDTVLNLGSATRGKIGKVYTQVLRNTKGSPPHDPLRLARAIVLSSEAHSVSPKLLSAILASESGYFVGAINSKTRDYGIGQISITNIRTLKLSKKKLLTDIEYSVDASALILSWFQERYAKKEPKTWFCRYNVGTRRIKGVIKRICVRYVKRVRRKL